MKHLVVQNDANKGFRLQRNKPQYWDTIKDFITDHRSKLYLETYCEGSFLKQYLIFFYLLICLFVYFICLSVCLFIIYF